jgi:hypothetical protein
MNRNGRAIRQPDAADDELRPEYDFSGGERGRHAHRFGEVAEDESAVAAFWQNRGFETRRFDEKETQFSKTPDFKLCRQGRLVAFCEVKTFQHDTWLDQAVEKAAPGELAGGSRPDPIYNRISNAVHTAVRQLEAVNLQHEALNFLVLVNRDKAAKPRDLTSVLTGYWNPLRGVFSKTHTAYSEGRIREEKLKIDLYVWMEPSRDGSLQARLFFFGNDKTKEQVCNLLELNSKMVQVIP